MSQSTIFQRDISFLGGALIFFFSCTRYSDINKCHILRIWLLLYFGNLLKCKPKYCFKKILHEDKLHFLVSFSFGKQFEERQNDPDWVFEGDIFAQTAAIPQWQALDQTLLSYITVSRPCHMSELYPSNALILHGHAEIMKYVSSRLENISQVSLVNKLVINIFQHVRINFFLYLEVAVYCYKHQ